MMNRVRVFRRFCRRLRLFCELVWRVTDTYPDGTVFRMSVVLAWEVAGIIYPWRASVAQTEEQLICNQQVVGSSPSAGSYCICPKRPPPLETQRYCIEHGGSAEDERLNKEQGAICERCRWEQIAD